MKVLVSSGAMHFTNKLQYSEGYNAFCLCRALAENGVKLTVLSPSAESSVDIDGANIVGFGDYTTTGDLRYFAYKWLKYNLSLLSKARKLIRDDEPDLVHHIFPSWIDYGYSLYPIFDRKRPFIYGPVLTQADRTVSQAVHVRDYFARLYRTSFSRRLYFETMKRADRVIVSVDDALNYLPEFVRSKSTTICHGVDTRFFHPKKPKESNPEFRVTYLGRLAPEKGVSGAIRAISLMRREVSNVLFQVAGDGPQRAELELLARSEASGNSVRFIGEIFGSRVPELLRDSDVLICPSIADASPTVLMQAMACGVPIVATNVGGIPEVLDYGRYGLLVSPNNPKELCEALVKLHKSPELAEKLGKRGRLEVERNYDWEVIARRVLEVYQECLA